MDVDEVTVKTDKPKDPKRVAWGKKMGVANKGKKREANIEEEVRVNYKYVYVPLTLAGVGLAFYVMYYSKPKPKEIEFKPVSTVRRNLNYNL